MKFDVFNSYVEQVSDLFDVDEEAIFTKTKRRDVVDARHLLYYLCSKRPMRVVYIQEYMAERGYVINHSSILHGISQVEEKVKKDKDYVKAVKNIERCATI